MKKLIKQYTLNKYDLKKKISSKKGGVDVALSVLLGSIFFKQISLFLAIGTLGLTIFIGVNLISTILIYIFCNLFKKKDKKNLKYFINEIYDDDSVNIYYKINIQKIDNHELSKNEISKIIHDTLTMYYKDKNIKVKDITKIILKLKEISESDKFRSKLKNKDKDKEQLNNELNLFESLLTNKTSVHFEKDQLDLPNNHKTKIKKYNCYYLDFI